SHAATMTHAGMAPEARAAAGIPETLLRIPPGIEAGDDLIAHLENGFRSANHG
ncbi:PLP-dependent transferase, partial [Escherichia coli]|uniref:PLP-dependent transferase n=1 Tax=Escherichia coli TaxID=562 RepID=UPI00148508A2